MTSDAATALNLTALEAITQALAAGDDVLAALLSAPDRRLMRVVALPRRFDRTLFARVLGPAAGASDDALVRLLGLGAVRAMPGRAGWYAVDDNRRAQWLDASGAAASEAGDLAAGAPRWREMHLALAGAFEAIGADAELEALYHRLSLHDAQAEAQWQTLYAAARERFDLARCESLLDLLSQRARFVSPGLASLMTRERGLLGARAGFADDYFRTSRYLERRQVLADFESLLADPLRFILQLHAPGGSGKTMFLRWLGARWCLPREIPIARVDFDFLDESERALAPPFLLGKLAERLDPQLGGAPFFELLRDVAEERRRSIGRKAGATLAADSPAQLLARLEQEVRERLARTLVERCAKRPVVLVFDTLEDATLKHQVNVLDVVEAIDAVRRRVLELAIADAAPRLVLILSGRYALAEQYPLVDRRFAPQLLACEVTPFDDAESRDYLQRRLTGIASAPAPEVIGAVVERAHGNPFKLALYADILLTTPLLEIEELGQGVDVDMLYLIERVLKRIPDERLRWLLRYGVLARRLTRAFVENVLLRAMRRALRGDTRADNPAEDGVAHKDWPRLWSAAAGKSRLDATELWQRLREYASASSWVSVDPNVGDAVVIQPAVSHPMRRALLHRERPVVEQIHRAAIAYARREGSERSDAERLAELSYHDFQRRGAAAAASWWSRLQAHALDDEVVDALASVVLSQDLAEAESNAAALVPDIVRARALFTLAALNARRAEASEDSTAASKYTALARQQLAQFDAIGLPEHTRAIPAAERGQLRLALATDAPQTQVALKELEDALRTRLDPELRSQVLLALERAYAPLDAERARRYARLWGTLAWRQGDAASYAEYVHDEIRRHQDLGAPRRALQLSQQTQAELGVRPGHWSSRLDAFGARRELADLEPQLLDRAGLAQAALKAHERRRAKHAPPARGEERERHDLQRAEWLLAAGQPRAAQELVAKVSAALPRRMEAAQTGSPRAESVALTVRARMVQARAARVLLDHGTALDALGQVMALHAGVGDHVAEVRARLGIARIYLLDLGNLRLAGEHLQDSDDALSGEDIALRADHLLLRAALHERLGDEDKRQQLLTLASNWLPDVPPRQWPLRLQLAVATLALDATAARNEQARALADILAGIDYVGLRLTAMRGLRQLAPLEGLPAALSRRLDRLCDLRPLRLPGHSRLLPGDRIRLAMQRAEMLRVLNQPERAVQALRALRPAVERQDPLPWQRQLAIGCDRLDIAPDEVLPPDWLPKLVGAQRRSRGFCAVLQAEAGERAARAGNPARAARLLRHALHALDEPGILPATWQAQALAAQLSLASRQPALFPGLDAKATLQRAQQIGDTLGLPPQMRAKIKALPPASSPSPAPSPPPRPDSAESAAAMGLRVVDPGSVTRVLHLENGQMQEERRTPLREPFVRMLAEFGAGRFSESASWELVSRLGQAGDGFGRDLARDALPEIVQLRLDHVAASGLAPLELLLEHKLPGMHAMPWELMVPQLAGPRPLSLNRAIKRFWRAPAGSGLRPRIAWVQRVLGLLGQAKLAADGLLGPATVGALRAWQKVSALEATGLIDDASLAQLRLQLAPRLPAASPPVPAVLLIKPMRESELSSQRGLSAGGADLEWLYRDRGVEVEVLTEPDPERLRATLGQRPWALVHIATPIAQSRSSRELSLQFAADHQSSHTTAFGASLLGRLMHAAPSSFPPPLVIIESPRPTSRDETIRQLLQRNAFAAQLFEYGELPAVVAMGLAPPEVQHLYSRALVQALVENLPAAELVARLREADPERGRDGHFDDGVELLPSAGIALFARDPMILPLPAKLG